MFHKENGGLSDTRNYGLERASGTHVTFIDSDDYIGEDYLALLIKLLNENRADLSVVNMLCFYDGSEPQYDASKNASFVESREEAMIDMMTRKHYGVSACAKLFDIHMFDEIRFPVGKVYEDLLTIPYVMWKCEKIACSESSKYFYRQRPNSIVNSVLTEKDYLIFDGNEKLRNFIDKNLPSAHDAANCRFMDDLINIIFHRLIHDPDYVKKMNSIIIENKTQIKEGIINPYLRRGRKIQLRLALLSPRLYKVVYSLKSRKESV